MSIAGCQGGCHYLWVDINTTKASGIFKGTEMYKTRMKYTMTSNGKVPHLSYKGIELPVSLNLDANIRYRADLYQQPNKTSDGKYIYALPGGGRYVG